MAPVLPHKIKQIIKIIKNKDFDVSDIKMVLKTAKISSSDLNDHLRFNHPQNESYGRSVLFQSPKFEIVLMSWANHDFTSIHDHGHAQWGAVLCFGKLIHTSFEKINNNLIISNKETLHNGEIKIVSEQLIHQMGNPFNKRALSLHIYGTKKNVAEVTGEAKNYDPVNRKIIYSNGGAFLEIPKHNILREEVFRIEQDEIFHDAVRILLNYKMKYQKVKTSESENICT